MRIEFRDVGRQKRNWDAYVPDGVCTEQELESLALREVRKRGGLISRDVDVEMEEGEKEGSIFAGFRAVGRFRIVEDAVARDPHVTLVGACKAVGAGKN